MRSIRPREFGPISAVRLAKSRLAAGFRSGRAAAETHGWPVGTYTSDESGSRTLTPSRAKLYAAAFDVPEDWLLGNPLPEASSSTLVRRARRLEQLHFDQIEAMMVGPRDNVPATPRADERLRAARRDAGFATARAAADFFGWTMSTYHSHENGQNNINSRTAKVYGLAFGAEPGWLLTGVVKPVGGVQSKAPTGGPRGTRDEVRLVAEAARSPPSTKARTMDASKVPSPPEGDDGHAGPTLSVLLSVKPTGSIVVAHVVEAPPNTRLKVGDQVVIDAGPRCEGGGLFASGHRSGSVRVLRIEPGQPSPADLLGRVILILCDPQ